ncbi:MAG: acyl-CoA dehydrogenase family protein [Sulfolobales archaeon]
MVYPLSSILDHLVVLEEEHELFRRSVENYATTFIQPYADRIDREDRIPDDLWDSIRKSGYLGLSIPQEYGGQGGDYRSQVIFAEEISRISPAVYVVFAVQNLFIYPLLLYGTEDQKRRFLPKIASGDIIAAHANTEPGAGSDVAGIRSRARKVNDHYLISGVKTFISLGDVADVFIVSARTHPPQEGRRWWGITTFIVERDRPGFKINRSLDKYGLRGSHVAELVLEDVKVPEENIIGEPGYGFKVVVETYDRARIGIAGQALGVARAALEKSVDYAVKREAFERKIIEFQGIQFYLADMIAKLEAARLVTYWAAYLADRNSRDFIIAASIAKILATEVAQELSIKAIDIHGGLGLMAESGVERLLRDSQILKIYEGTTEIQKLTIIKQIIRRFYGLNI